MDALKAQFERIRQQLSALTGTQKMLVAALVAIMVLTMLYWGKYAQNAEMVSILGEQTLAEEDIGPIDKQLELAGVQHTVVSGKIMVPADRQAELLANLMFARVLPSDTHSAFETMSKTLNPFSSNEEREASYSQATANELSDIISRFPGVANARVVLNSKNITRIEGSIPPSATVFISTRGEVEDVKGLVRAAADGVAHAVSGLTPSQISVIVNRRSMKVPDADGSSMSMSDELNDLRKAREADLQDKILRIMMIDGLSVAVNCDVENSSTESTNEKFSKPDTLVLPEHTTSDTLETVQNAPTSHEPGVGPNTGTGGAGSNGPASIDGGGASAGSSPNTTSSAKESTDNRILPGHTQTHIVTPAGKDKVLSATVRVPLSYFPIAYKRLHPSAPAPDEGTLATATNAELVRIREAVKNVVGLKTDGDLSVDYYADAPPDTTVLAMAGTPVSTLTTVKGSAKEIGIAVLAIVSLLMMASLVRKSAPPRLATASAAGTGTATGGPVPAARSPLGTLGGGEDVAGEVGVGGAALDGVEMDEEAVRTQQMVSQVSTMVKENPDGAATLVKRWLSRP